MREQDTTKRPGPKNQPVAPRFFAFIERVPDGCWMWCGTLNPRGYGTLSVNGRGRLAHRVSWEIHYGPIPEGMGVLHTCDNRDCVNPDHLFLGTAKDNMDDRSAKGRSGDRRTFYGEEHHSAKLTADDVREIRRVYEAGEANHRAIAARYGVSEMAVSKITRYVTWKDVSPLPSAIDPDAGAAIRAERTKRQFQGEGNGRAKLTADDVRAIRTLYAAGVSNSALADRYNVRHGTISKIVGRTLWQSIE